MLFNAFKTDEIQRIEEGGTVIQSNSENNANWSKKEKERAEGMIEIAGDTEAGREDKTEDKDETEDRVGGQAGGQEFRNGKVI